MTVGRRTGAPRLIDWTGERCVPWAPDVQVVYEHMHRYLWATRAGRRPPTCWTSPAARVSAPRILARVGRVRARVSRSTSGPSTTARSTTAANAISFSLGDAQDLSAFDADASFGAVVAFEMIEHVAEQERVLGEVGTRAGT